MAYMSPGAAAALGLEGFMMKREELKRQAEMDKREAQAADDRHKESEARVKAAEESSADKAASKREAKIVRTVAGMVPGDIPAPADIAEARTFGVPMRIGTNAKIDTPQAEMPSQVVQTMGGETPAPPAPKALPLRFAGSPAQAEKVKTDEEQATVIAKLQPGSTARTVLEARAAGLPVTGADIRGPVQTGGGEFAFRETLSPEDKVRFDKYQNEDANRKAKAAGSGNSPQPQIFYSADGKPHAIQFKNGIPNEIQLPAGIVGKTNPVTAQVWSRVNAAKKVGSHIEDLKQEIEEADARGLLGPLKGRANDFMLGKIGSTGDPANDELLAGLRLDISAVKSGFGMVHSGSRSAIGLLQRWDDVLNGKQMSKDALIGSLNAMQGWLDSYAADPTKTEKELADEKTDKGAAGAKTPTTKQPKKSAEDLFNQYYKK